MKKLKHKTTVPDSLLAQAVALQEKGAIAEAETLYRQCLALNPKNHWALYSLSVIAVNRKDIASALKHLEAAVSTAPSIALLWYAHGAVLMKSEREKEALISFDRALKLDSQNIDALNDSAAILHRAGFRTEALERFERLLAIDPNNIKALSNLSVIQAESIKDADLVNAVASLEKLVALQPDYAFALGRLEYQRLHICEWRNYAATVSQVLANVRAAKRACTPIPCMMMSSSAEEHQTCMQTYAKFFFKNSQSPLWTGEKYHHKRIRVAYVSPDFREHPVGQLMAGVFERHDKSQFETVAISLCSNDTSALHHRLRNAFDHFVDAHQMSMREIAELMHRMEIDIAVDLAGYTAHTGSFVFAHRPAPVQINYLGFPGTLGADFMDYILADRHVIPPDHHAHYNEKVIYLPDTYLPTDSDIAISERTPTRADCDLPETGFVFCSFSHDHKISPPVFDVWMRLLQQVPGSVLWLMSRLTVSASNLKREAAARGVDPSRLVFARRLDLVEDHLARYRLADIFLDTYPYNAHTTAADALLVGLPVLTCMGQSFPSRVAGSVLHAIGVPELITNSLEAYESLALHLAKTPALLANLKAKIANNRFTHALFDTDAFCRNLESVYKRLHGVRSEVIVDSNTVTDTSLLLQAIAQQESGQDLEAERLLNLCLAKNPQNPLALFALGTIYMTRDAPELTLTHFEQAVIKSPLHAPLWFALGVARSQSGQREEAVLSYDEALKLDPSHIGALNNSCVLLQELQRHGEAQERYSRLLELQSVNT